MGPANFRWRLSTQRISFWICVDGVIRSAVSLWVGFAPPLVNRTARWRPPPHPQFHDRGRDRKFNRPTVRMQSEPGNQGCQRSADHFIVASFRCWPCGQPGKEKISTRTVLGQKSGLAGPPTPERVVY
jgi:hypothetical protein